MMDEVEIRRPNYLSYVSGGESDTEAESVIDEPKRFEDFEDRYLSIGPFLRVYFHHDPPELSGGGMGV